jgi:demethylmenaquinone methyltransferase/2-methoxy-6-polyprenyl-1,4-benzoquinol methylase
MTAAPLSDDPRIGLGRAFESREAKRRYVRTLFSTIADRYDLITVLLSYGQDRKWKRRLVGMAPAARGIRALDLACGTGDIAFALADRGARVTGLDITHRMVQLAREKRQAAAFVTADMMSLPFASDQFDLVTTGYGIRNVPELVPALAEIYRVLKPGGVFLSLDFNRPANPLIRAIYLGYLTLVGSALGYVLHRDADTYRYIPESIRHYPGAVRVSELLREQGFASSQHLFVLGGLMAIHRASKPHRVP